MFGCSVSFFGEISCTGDLFKTHCDKHKGFFWGKKKGTMPLYYEEMVVEFSIFRQ
jgi:hypothetical protein